MWSCRNVASIVLYLHDIQMCFKYTTQSLISIKTLFLLTGDTNYLTPKILILVYICSRTTSVQTFHLFFALPASASRRLAETMENPKLKLSLLHTFTYPIRFYHSLLLTGSFSCKTVLMIEISILLCLLENFRNL